MTEIETPCLFVKHGNNEPFIMPEMAELTKVPFKKFKERVKKHFGLETEFSFQEFADHDTGYKKWILDSLLNSEETVLCTVKTTSVPTKSKSHSTYELATKEGVECIVEKIWTKEPKESMISSVMHRITEPPGDFLDPMYKVRGELVTDRVWWMKSTDRGEPVMMRMVYRTELVPKLVTTIIHQIPDKQSTTMSKYEKGRKVTVIGYIFDQRFKHGPAKYYSPFGNIAIESEYHVDRLHGKYHDHMRHVIHHYDRGVLHGVTDYYDVTGEELVRSEEYINGKMVAQWICNRPSFLDRQLLKNKVNTVREELYSTQIVWTYWESIQDKFPQPIINVGDEIIIPVGEPTYRDVSLVEIDVLGGLLTNGQVYETFRKRVYDNGMLLRDTCYKKDKLHGICKEMHSGTGIVKSIEEYKDDVLHGTRREWFPNGKLKMEGTYQEGKLIGQYCVWHQSGHVLMFKSVYNENGNLHGDQVIYAPDLVKVRLRLDIPAPPPGLEHEIDKTKIGLINFKQFEVPVVSRHAQYNNGVITGPSKEWYLSTKRKKMILHDHLGNEVMTDVAEYTLPVNEHGWYELSFNDKTGYQNMCDCIGEFFMYDGELKTFLPKL
jgi:antitoxin component YwqK of YwqJK toxin-antitoxin module